MDQNTPNVTDDPTIMGNDQPRRDKDGHHPAADADRDHRDRAVDPKNPSSADQATHEPKDRHGEDRNTM